MKTKWQPSSKWFLIESCTATNHCYWPVDLNLKLMRSLKRLIDEI
ncbi:hypothetical protein [Laspinema olomoucense]|nr:hypothetical protein [Laspinema sp. D3a]